MDIYLALRLFKDFDNNPTKNIIIHVGRNHILTYINILKSMHFKIKEIAKSKEKRCLDISKMKQPFFT